MNTIIRGNVPKWAVTLVLAAVFVLGPVAAGAQDHKMERSKSDRLKLIPCRVQGADKEVRCGTLDVYEDRATGRGRRIGLNVVVLPALGDKPAPDPLFFLAGGPGQAGTAMAEFVIEHFGSIRQERDLVLVDQRGTGHSNPLTCRLWEAEPNGYFGDYFPAGSVENCRAELEKRADLRLYTTPLAMDDLDDVRAALGYERINIYGTSYGTLAAQVYLRRHPSRVRSVILKGVLSPDVVIPVRFAADSQRALDLLFDNCGADKECNRAFPNLRQDYESLLGQLDRGAIKADVAHPSTGKITTVGITRGTFGTTLRTLLQSTSSSRGVPMMIHRAATGDPAPLRDAIIQTRKALTDSIDFGMQFSILASEFISRIDSKQVAKESRNTFLGPYWTDQALQACRFWPGGRVDADYSNPAREPSSVPFLLISGFLDPATPPRYGDAVARLYPNSLHVVIRNGSHSYSGLAPCVDNLMAGFIKAGSAMSLDASCTDQIKLPAFITASP